MNQSRTIPLSQGQSALVDESTYSWLSKWKWCASWNPGTRSFYAVRQQRINGVKRTMYMHREILGLKCGDGKTGDHRNAGATLDNRMCNLRVATSSQNLANSRLSRGNTARLKGVTFDKERNKWMAKIKHDYQSIFLGRFSTAELAHSAYREAALRIYGDFARDG